MNVIIFSKNSIDIWLEGCFARSERKPDFSHESLRGLVGVVVREVDLDCLVQTSTTTNGYSQLGNLWAPLIRVDLTVRPETPPSKAHALASALAEALRRQGVPSRLN